MWEKGGGGGRSSHKGNTDIDPSFQCIGMQQTPLRGQSKENWWLGIDLPCTTTKQVALFTLITPSFFSQLIARDFVRVFLFDTLRFIPLSFMPLLTYFFFPLHTFISLSIWTAYWAKKKRSTNKRWKKGAFRKGQQVPRANERARMRTVRKTRVIKRVRRLQEKISYGDAFLSSFISFFFTHFPSLLVCFSWLLTTFFTSLKSP